ncbi:MAG: kinase/pyrophosphorylase, partial [Pseudomonadota bacterium]
MSAVFHLHLISDATGETLSAIVRASLAQFDDVEIVEHVWSLVRTSGQV